MAFTVIGVALGIRNLQNFTPQFVATMVVAPYGVGGGVGGGQHSQISSLARNLGISVAGPKQATTFDRLRLLIASVQFSELMDEKYDLLRTIYGNAWDPVEQKWRRPTGKRFEWEQRIRSALNLRTWREPDIESLSGYLGSAIVLDDVAGGTFMRLSHAHTDPGFGLQLLSTTYEQAEEMLRELDRRETAERKQYLQRRLETASLVELRQVLLDLMRHEERTSMLLEGHLPYVARIIEPPYVSSRPTTRNFLSDFSTYVLTAFALGMALVTVVTLFRRE